MAVYFIKNKKDSTSLDLYFTTKTHMHGLVELQQKYQREWRAITLAPYIERCALPRIDDEMNREHLHLNPLDISSRKITNFFEMWRGIMRSSGSGCISVLMIVVTIISFSTTQSCEHSEVLSVRKL